MGEKKKKRLLEVRKGNLIQETSQFQERKGQEFQRCVLGHRRYSSAQEAKKSIPNLKDKEVTGSEFSLRLLGYQSIEYSRMLRH